MPDAKRAIVEVMSEKRDDLFVVSKADKEKQ